MALPPINISVVPPKAQRYQTVGDWFERDGIHHIVVSEMDEDSEFLVALHELAEWYLCRKAGITEAAVDAFDNTKLGKRYDEHGDDPKAPYHKQHMLAGIIERLVARELGVDWEDHADRVEAADEKAAK